jgi:acetoin utilization deacetylase AcuC-like enzyme
MKTLHEEVSSMDYAIITGPGFSRHDCPGHPECQARLDLALGGVPPGISRIIPRKATDVELARVHDQEYIARVRERSASCPPGRCLFLDPDTYVTPDSFDVARSAAGSAILAAQQALAGTSCFALVRPPGHHSGPRYAMGFCLFNNAAIAAAYAVSVVDRVAIIDWDVHHGNGTQDSFYDSGQVLYCSVHQEYAYPGTGTTDETGVGEGRGYNVNVPVPAGSTIAEYRDAFRARISPAVTAFDPDLVIVSAGQDILYDDPLGSIRIMPEDFVTLTRLVMPDPCRPVALVLEGGYGTSHAKAIAAICSVLGGDR